jgi:hypothetical protein
MIVRSRLSGSARPPSSSRSSAAWPIDDSGLRISCAIEAVSRPQRHQLHLLGLGAHPAKILDEDHDGRGIAAADGHEVNLQLARGARGLHLDEESLGPALAPALQQARDLRRVLVYGRPAALRQHAEELRRARVVLADAPVAVDHEDAVLHVADHDLVDLRQVGEVDSALRRDLLAGARVARERGGEARGGEEGTRGNPGLHELLRDRVVLPELEGLLEQHRERGGGGVEVGEAAARDEARRGERDQQHHAEPRAHAAARVHQHHDRDHVEEDAAGHLQREAGLAQPRRDEQRDRE